MDLNYKINCNNSNKRLQYILGDSYDSIPKPIRDAYNSIVGQLNTQSINKNRCENATDQQLKNWQKGNEFYNNNQGNWENELFNEFFRKNKDGDYEPNPDNDFITNEDYKMSDLERDKIIGELTENKILPLPGNDLSQKFHDADKTNPVGVDPLIVDLDGNGIETTPLTDGMMIDHEGDGFKELSSWVGGNDGILAYDKNGNGIIDNGNELFGDNYIKSDGTKASSGFDALSDLDSNNDGVINSSDEKFSELQVIKADGSIVSASEAGIASINLSSQQTNQTPDVNGNTEKVAA